MKKYEFTGEVKMVNGVMLRRIQATENFGNVRVGDFGGWIEKESNLSCVGNCWIHDNACVYGNANVRGNANIYDNAQVYDAAMIYGEAIIANNARVYHNAHVFDSAEVRNNAKICGYAHLFGNCTICDNAVITGSIFVADNIYIGNNAKICSSKDYLIFHNVGMYGDNIVAFRATDNDVFIRGGYFCCTLSKFESEINECKAEKVKKYTQACIDAIKIHFNIKEKEKEKRTLYIDDFKKWAYEQKEEFDISENHWNIIHNKDTNKIVVINCDTEQVGFSHCHSKDKFDLNVGIGVAYARAMGREIPKERKKIIKKLRDLKHGERFREIDGVDKRTYYFMGVNPCDDYQIIYVDEFTKKIKTMNGRFEVEVIE